MGKQVAVSKTEVAVSSEDLEMYGSDVGDSSDILIPKVLLMQGQSQMVLDSEAAFGEFRHSLTKEKLGDIKSPIKILPFYMYKQWLVSKKNGERWEFHTVEPHVTGVTHEYTEEVNGEWFKFEETMCYYCFLEGVELPVVVAFKSTSKKAGKNMYTQMFVINRSVKRLPFSNWFELRAVKETKNNNTYAKFDIGVGEDASPEMVAKCKEWFKIVRTTEVRVDNSDVERETTETPVQMDADDKRF